MTQVMKGVRILGVSHFTFVPAAGAALGDLCALTPNPYIRDLFNRRAIGVRPPA
jgi:hypothetical protein